MRNILLLTILLASPFVMLSQRSSASYLTFLDEKIKVPSNCIAESPFELACEDVQMSWIYYPPKDLPDFIATNWLKVKERYPTAFKHPVEVTLYGKKAIAQKIIIRGKDQTIFQIWAYATFEEKGVFFQLVTAEDPVDTKAIPKIARKLIQIEKQ